MRNNIVDILVGRPGYIGSNGRTGENIVQAEKELGVKFAEDYYMYLKEIGLACFDGHEFTGLTQIPRLDVVRVTQEQRKRFEMVELSWYVVEVANIDEMVMWQDVEGTIYATMPYAKIKKIANSLSEYIMNF